MPRRCYGPGGITGAAVAGGDVVTDVAGLYLHPPGNAIVLSIDERTPSHPPRPAPIRPRLMIKIRAFINGWNDRGQPFVRTKTADQILTKADRKTTSVAVHWDILFVVWRPGGLIV
jgi:hypothetical protein